MIWGDQVVGRLTCSFCSKGRSAVLLLIKGERSDVCICNECVELCAEVIALRCAARPHIDYSAAYKRTVD